MNRAPLIASLVLLAAPAVRADPTDDAATVADASSDAPPPLFLPPLVRAPPDDPAWILYSEAFRASAAGSDNDAIQILETLMRDYAEHPAAGYARRIALMLDARRGDTPSRLWRTGEAPKPRFDLEGEAPSALARAELAIFQTGHGILQGIELCALATCQDVRGITALSLVGGSLGLGVALGATGDGIRPGSALALDSGTLWGLWNGAALSLALDVKGDSIAGMLMVGQLSGLAIGGAIAAGLQPTAGEISLANSAGIWMGVLTLLGHSTGALELSDDKQAVFLTALVASDAGLIIGALLARDFPMSRSRSIIVDAAGILGTLTGFGLDLMAEGRKTSDGMFYGLGMAGLVAGLGAGAALTRDWDFPEGSGQLTVLPEPGGARLALAWRF